MKLLCIPYAAGSGSMFYGLQRYLKKEIEIVTIELPGRGRRMDESPIYSFSEALHEIKRLIDAYAEEDYFLLGYSYGSMLAFEAVRQNMVKPKHLFLAALEPPMYHDFKDKYKMFSDDEMLDELIKEGSIEHVNKEERKFLNIFVPLIRADFSAIADYHYVQDMKKVDCCTTILFSPQDIDLFKIRDWNTVFTYPCDIKAFAGDHFFIRDNYKEIAELINKVYIEKMNSINYV